MGATGSATYNWSVARWLHPRAIWAVVKASFTAFLDDSAPRLAAALAYYTLFSIAPVLVIAVAVAGAIFGPAAARGEVVAQVHGLMGDEGARLLQTGILRAAHRVSGTGLWASILNAVVLLLAASGAFVELQADLNAIWGVKPKPGTSLVKDFLRSRLLSFAMVLLVGFLLLVSLVLSAALSGFGRYLSKVVPIGPWFWTTANVVLSVLVITLLFAMIFRFLPDVRIAWGDVWFGALLTSALFTGGKYLIGLYLGNAPFTSTYGAAGVLVVLLAWVYYSALILFLGAEFTQVFAKRHGSRLRPARHAVLRNPEDASR